MVPLATALLLLQAKPKVHRVVVEVAVPGSAAHGLILGNVANLRKALAPERTEVEVVCHGSGIGMLLAKGSVGRRVASLAQSGVEFVVCANTMRGRHIARAALPAFVRVVPSGVGEVVRRQEAGWTYLKGGF